MPPPSQPSRSQINVAVDKSPREGDTMRCHAACHEVASSRVVRCARRQWGQSARMRCLPDAHPTSFCAVGDI